MARQITWGTPSRSSGYQRPRGRGRLLAAALALGGLAAGAMLAAQAVGARAMLAPGTMSSAHAPMADRCEECHGARDGVRSELCERCHDPADSKSLTHEAHVRAGAGPGRAAAAEELPCARCHGEHRGREARLAGVSGFECAQCHFRSFARHPDFAAVREGRSERPGLRFDHAEHLQVLSQIKGGGGSALCTQCHEPDPEGRDYLPLSFERHCADCHEDGSWRHRDPRLLERWHALRRQLDPGGYAAELGALQRRLEQLRDRRDRIGRAGPGGQAPPAVLTLGARKRLEKEIELSTARLRLISGGETTPAAVPSAPERARARAELDALVAPCVACHVPEPSGAFAAVRAARSLLTGAAFAHAPHLLYSDCARCHAAIVRSHAAEELHLEGISTCRNCHGPGGVRDDCQGCHRYHPGRAF